MGFQKWLQRKGATGGIVRWAFDGYQTLRQQRPDLTEEAICAELFRLRFKSKPPRGAELRRYELALLTANVSDLRRLCMEIAQIEFGIHVTRDEVVWNRTLEAIQDELEELGYVWWGRINRGK